MRNSRLIGMTAALVVLAGCGNRDLILRVDIKSFLTPAQTQQSFGPIPAIPGGGWSGEQALVNDNHINMLSGLGNAVVVKHVEVTLATIVTSASGTGVDTMRVYVSDLATDPRSTAPVFTQVLNFVPGTSDTVTSVLTDDARVDSLFTQKTMRLTVTTSLRGPASGSALNGGIEIHTFDAVAVAGRKMN